MRLYVIGRLTPATARLSISDGLRMIPKALAKYLWLTVFPAGYNMQHVTTPVPSLWAPDFIVPLLILAALLLSIILIRSRLLFFAAIWFVVWLAPVLAALRMFFSVHAVLERYLYLPSIGICLAAALGIEWIASRKMLTRFRPIPQVGLTSLLSIGLLVICVQQNAVWKDNLTLYRRAVEVNPDSPLAHTALSTQYTLLGRTDEAGREARVANELDPHCIDAYVNLAYLARGKGDGKAAIAYLEGAKSLVREGPLKSGELATVCFSLAELYQQLKMKDLAEQNFLEAANLLPSSNRVWEELGEFYYEQGRPGEALEIFRKASQGLSRAYAPIHLELGRTYERLNDLDKARIEYQDYLRFAPAADDAEEVRRRLSRL
jgi:tetratricopeptide (TPR) repeat protein